jgi:hypothetical protein
LLRDCVLPENVGKTKPLLDLPGATERLSIWKADLADEDSFDEAIRGCTGVFHVATPTDFESKDPEVNKRGSVQFLHESTSLQLHVHTAAPVTE